MTAPARRPAGLRAWHWMAVLPAVLLLGGCGGGPSAVPASASSASSNVASGSSAGAHNATDVMFLQMMLAREQDTARLTGRAQGRVLPGQVTILAAAIASTQADEMTTMTGWLHAWQQPVAMAGDPSLHADHGGTTSLDAADLAALDQAEGTDYTQRLLNLLIAQQHNAVELAGMETGAGVHGPARALARRISESRTAEVAQMLTLAAHPGD